jgi:hypothetical protein
VRKLFSFPSSAHGNGHFGERVGLGGENRPALYYALLFVEEKAAGIVPSHQRSRLVNRVFKFTRIGVEIESTRSSIEQIDQSFSADPYDRFNLNSSQNYEMATIRINSWDK